jgi:hypothetical protein
LGLGPYLLRDFDVNFYEKIKEENYNKSCSKTRRFLGRFLVRTDSLCSEYFRRKKEHSVHHLSHSKFHELGVQEEQEGEFFLPFLERKRAKILNL